MASAPPKATLTLGTRRSALARVQTDLVAHALTALYPSLTLAIEAMDPLGDRDKVTALYRLADGAAAKSVWTGELEDRLAAHGLDAIVHSLKDMPTSLPPGLVLGAVLEREDARDALVLKRSASSASSSSSSSDRQSEPKRSAAEILEALPDGSIIGTSSLRRIAQLRRRFPHLRYEVARGNVPTRLQKLDAPETFVDCPAYTALVVASAGLKRLDLAYRIDAYLSGDERGGGMLWAVGQGAIGIECREDDAQTRQMLERINHGTTWLAVCAERTLLRTLEGGCSVPIGVETSWAGSDTKTLALHATVVSIDGQTVVETKASSAVSTTEQAEELGTTVAVDLLGRGASGILDAIMKEKKMQLEQEAEAVAAAEATAQVIV